jgi:antitoxin (DNA-binding transcriptional repressor) of toxin-antitoxin stability system
MGRVAVQFASKCLEDLIRRAADGEEIVIVRGKTPVARLTALASKPAKRRFGAYRGEFEVPESFFEGESSDADPLSASVPKGARGRPLRRR